MFCFIPICRHRIQFRRACWHGCCRCLATGALQFPLRASLICCRLARHPHDIVKFDMCRCRPDRFFPRETTQYRAGGVVTMCIKQPRPPRCWFNREIWCPTATFVLECLYRTPRISGCATPSLEESSQISIQKNSRNSGKPIPENPETGSCEEIGQVGSTELLRKSKMTVHCMCVTPPAPRVASIDRRQTLLRTVDVERLIDEDHSARCNLGTGRAAGPESVSRAD
jgi:hypothetical protein